MLPFYVLIYTEPRSVHSKPRSRSSAAPESTGSHLAVLSPSIALSLSNTFLFMGFRTLCPQRSTATPLQSTVCALFPVQRRGRGSNSSPNLQTLQRVTFKRSLSPLECAVPGFRRVTPLKCAVAKTRSRNSFRMRSSEKRWGEGNRPSQRSPMKGELRGLLGSLRELPAEAAFDAEIALRHGMVERRTHFHDSSFLGVHRQFASDSAVRTDRFRARLFRFVPGSRRAHVVFDFAHQRARGAHGDTVPAVHARRLGERNFKFRGDVRVEPAPRHANRERVLCVHAARFHALVAEDAFRV